MDETEDLSSRAACQPSHTSGSFRSGAGRWPHANGGLHRAGMRAAKVRVEAGGVERVAVHRRGTRLARNEAAWPICGIQ